MFAGFFPCLWENFCENEKLTFVTCKDEAFLSIKRFQVDLFAIVKQLKEKKNRLFCLLYLDTFFFLPFLSCVRFWISLNFIWSTFLLWMLERCCCMFDAFCFFFCCSHKGFIWMEKCTEHTHLFQFSLLIYFDVYCKTLNISHPHVVFFCVCLPLKLGLFSVHEAVFSLPIFYPSSAVVAIWNLLFMDLCENENFG